MPLMSISSISLSDFCLLGTISVNLYEVSGCLHHVHPVSGSCHAFRTSLPSKAAVAAATCKGVTCSIQGDTVEGPFEGLFVCGPILSPHLFN